MRRQPVETMNAALPRLRRITGEYGVAGDVRIRPVDLYVSTGYRKAGIVLVGDAFAATCPMTGTGTDKVLTDVTQLCNIHVPNWLATEGMGEDKIAMFYDNPVKQACDAWSAAQSFSFLKVTMDNGPYWQAQRWGRFLVWLSRVSCGGRATASAVRQNFAPARQRHLQCRLRPDRDQDAVNASSGRGGESRRRSRLRSVCRRS